MNDLFSGSFFFWWKAIAIIVSVGALTAIIIVVVRTQELWQWRRLRELRDFLRSSELPRETRATRWTNVEKRIASPHPSDWKLAVIEADSIMDDLLKRMGYEGFGLGERLKQVEPSDFQALNDVWKAHKMRNRIAHEPESAVTKSEAEYAIELFKRGLKEFEYI